MDGASPPAGHPWPPGGCHPASPGVPLVTRHVLFALVAAALASLASAAEPLTVVADEYCPYNCVPGSAAPGYGIELLTKVFAAKGIAVEYRAMKWDDALKAARAGEASAVIGALKADAPDFVFPAQEIGLSRNGFIVRKDDGWRYAGPKSLDGRRLGVIEGYAYGAEVEGWIKAHPASVVRSGGADPLLLQVGNLLQGTVDVVVEDASVLAYVGMKDRLWSRVAPAGMAGSADPLYVAFAPGAPHSKEYARVLAEGIAAMRASGELAALLKRYGLKDWR